MTKCDCNEKIVIKINSWKQFEELKDFFEEKPYHTGYSVNGNAMKWYADKWYKCLECDVLWEFIYPDFPAQGSVRKLSADDYMERK